MTATLEKPDIVTVLESEGIELKLKGSHLWALCPLHAEDTASFKVDPGGQTYYCFGCHEHGDVISIIMKMRDLSYTSARKYLGISEEISYRSKLRTSQKKTLIVNFKRWGKSYFIYLCDILRNLEKVKARIKTENEVEAFAEYYHKESLWTLHLEILQGRDDASKLELYREVAFNDKRNQQ